MRPIDGDRLMMHLTDWWYSSFGQTETEESKAIKTVLDKIEQTLGEFALEKQEADRWIPVTERLPEDNTEVFVYLFDTKTPYIAWICDGQWYTEEFRVEKQNEPIAWRPLPEAYTEEDDD